MEQELNPVKLRNLRRRTSSGASMVKNIANIITSTRFLFALGMVLTAPFSSGFWACYLGGGVSDLLDGMAARGLHQQSAAGAKLDSAADLAFAVSIAVVVLRYIPLPSWLVLCAAGIAAIRLTSLCIGFAKYRTYSALHTYANKLTGALVFGFPLLYTALGLTGSGILLCAVAFISSVEELVITIGSSVLNRDCKGICQIKQHRGAKP